MWNARLDESEAGMKIAGRNIKNLRYADDTTLDVRKQKGAKEPFLRVKKKSEKASLMLNIQKMKITPSVPSLHRRRRKNGNNDRLYFLGLQNHWGWWLQPWNKKVLAPWKKSYDKLSTLKSRDIILVTKVHIVKVKIFPVHRYGCELNIEELMLLNSGVGEDSWKSLRQQGDQTRQS